MFDESKSSMRGADERGVSPVLGVALLIGITVTLVAVVGIVVMGIGPANAGAPSAKMAMVTDSATDTTVDITHNGGDAVKTKDIVVKVDGSTVSDSSNNLQFASTPPAELTAGDTITVEDTNTTDGTGLSDAGSDTVRIIWNSPNGDNTVILAEYKT